MASSGVATEFGSESYTEIRYREDNEVASRLATIEDSGSSVFTRSADWFKPFVGRAIEVEDIYGLLHASKQAEAEGRSRTKVNSSRSEAKELGR